MFCKKCGANIDEGTTFCAGCGAPVPEIEPEIVPAQEEPQTVDEPAVPVEKVTKTKQSQLDPEAKKQSSEKLVKLIVTIVCFVLLAGIMAVVILKSQGLLGSEDKAQNVQTTPTDSLQQTEDTTETTGETVDYPDMSADDAKILENRDAVVATVGDYELTVSQLQLHYWFQVYMYQEKYAAYINAGYISLDVTAPLAAQPCAEDPTISWQQFFVKKSLTSWQSYAIMNMMADQEGFEMDPKVMEDLKASTLEDAKAAGFDTVESYIENMLTTEVCSSTTVDDYWAYMEFWNRATTYFGHWYEKATPTADEIEKYYAENEKTFVDGGAGKDAGYGSVDVRHILIMVDEDTDAAWKAAEAEANKILQEWKDGGATEELFAELANKYSDDGGSNTNGGLYAGVQPGQMVEVFNNWILDGSRKHGDTDILKADYHYQGFHIMYFVDGDLLWKNAVMQTMLTQRSAEMVTSGMEQWPMEKNEDNILLGTPKFDK